MSRNCRRFTRTVATLTLIAAPLTFAPLRASLAQPTERIDAAALAKIREEGMQRSKVMEITSYLTDVYGARLTGSPSTKAAALWTVDQLRSWGASNPRLETWGPFTRLEQREVHSARCRADTIPAHCVSRSLVARHERSGHR